MKTGPDFALVASLIGDPARANMLTALMSGRALTASELAQEAGITPQTASSHLAKLETGRLVALEKQGRHRYYRLKGPEVATALEGLMGLAARAGHLRVRTGPKDPALRRARVCYDHLAGDLGVQMLESMLHRHLIEERDDTLSLTSQGRQAMARFGLDLALLEDSRRPLCKTCLDWSARRSHLAGTLGAAILSRLFALKWARRETGSRIVSFTPRGEKQFAALFGTRRRQAANCAVDSDIQKNA
ncbi:MAG: winged helix-turn-helix transcriptional regulator [Afipia sp.]|nr:winged helix-turn-helix transcriptional regulator [Afipia sp.]OJW61837.1 MAG: transcriptional regulator [Afipia sp. 64-13]